MMRCPNCGETEELTYLQSTASYYCEMCGTSLEPEDVIKDR